MSGELMPCTKKLLQNRLDPEYVEPTDATEYLAAHDIGNVYACDNRTGDEDEFVCKALLRIGENSDDLPEIQTPTGSCLAELNVRAKYEQREGERLTTRQVVLLLGREGYKKAKKRQ